MVQLRVNFFLRVGAGIYDFVQLFFIITNQVKKNESKWK